MAATGTAAEACQVGVASEGRAASPVCAAEGEFGLGRRGSRTPAPPWSSPPRSDRADRREAEQGSALVLKLASLAVKALKGQELVVEF